MTARWGDVRDDADRMALPLERGLELLKQTFVFRAQLLEQAPTTTTPAAWLTEVVRFIEEHAADGATTTLLWDALESVPCTQATVALEFLKDRGLVEIARRRCFPGSGGFFEEAMCEWHVLAHKCGEGV